MLSNSKHRSGGVFALHTRVSRNLNQPTDRPLSAKIACLPCLSIATCDTSTSCLHFSAPRITKKWYTRPFCEMNFGSSLWRRKDKRVVPLTFRPPAMGDVSGFRKSDTPGGRCGKPIPRVGQSRQVYLYVSVDFLIKIECRYCIILKQGSRFNGLYRANKTITFNGY